MQYNEFSKELDFVLKNQAAGQSRKYFHTFCGTPHLFLATFAFLCGNVDEKYKSSFDTLKPILNKYGVDGKKFEKAFLTFFPKGEKPEEGEAFEIATDSEYRCVIKELRSKGLTEKRTMDINDLILILFLDKNYNIFTIFSDIIGSEAKTEEMYNEIVKAFGKKTQRKIAELDELEELTNLNEWVAKNSPTVIDADETVMKIQMALSGRSIKNCMITGPAGAGKTTYVYEFVKRIIDGDCPAQFNNTVVYELNSNSLVAGTKYRGQFEEKLMNIIEVLRKTPNVILFVDEAHTLSKLGAAEGAAGFADIVKPYITRGEIQIIGCTTAEEYTKFILPDKAFASRFHEVKIKEPTKAATKKILQGILPVETEFFNKKIQDELLDRVIDLSEKYSLDQANPRKAINMLELACAYCKVFEEKKEMVDVDDVINSISLRYNVYISKDKLKDTKTGLFQTLLGQDDALNQVMRNLQIVDAELTDLQKPCLSMLLCGPTGTGKTETCRIIAKNFFGSEDNLVKINMGEYSSEFDVSKIAGSAPGYAGYDDEPALIKGVREKPNSVVLFDEIEKAHPSIQKILLNILDTGEMQDNKGNRVSFRNTIIIFTTNLGCNHKTGLATGMGFIKSTVGSGKNDILKAIKDYFSPEFLGRLDDIVYYNSLSKDVLTQLIIRYSDEYKNRSTRPEVKAINLTEADIEDIFKEANIETQGARGVRKAVQKKLADLYMRAFEAEPVTA